MKKLLALLCITFAAVQSVLAQAPPPSGSPPSSFVGAPIDEYAWVPALMMVVYGIYAISKKQLKPVFKRIK